MSQLHRWGDCNSWKHLVTCRKPNTLRGRLKPGGWIRWKAQFLLLWLMELPSEETGKIGINVLEEGPMYHFNLWFDASSMIREPPCINNFCHECTAVTTFQMKVAQEESNSGDPELWSLLLACRLTTHKGAEVTLRVRTPVAQGQPVSKLFSSLAHSALSSTLAHLCPVLRTLSERGFFFFPCCFGTGVWAQGFVLAK
jgi:hypothetical protein